MARPDPLAKFIRPGTFRWAICDCCEGSGTRDNPAFSNGITSSEWHDEWDDDDRQAYLSGRYDVPCGDCAGSGKVRQIIVACLTWAERRELVEERRRDRARAEMAAEYRAEQRHCGYEC